MMKRAGVSWSILKGVLAKTSQLPPAEAGGVVTVQRLERSVHNRSVPSLGLGGHTLTPVFIKTGRIRNLMCEA